MSAASIETSALQRFARSSAVEIRNGIMFDFYMELPHKYRTSNSSKPTWVNREARQLHAVYNANNFRKLTFQTSNPTNPIGRYIYMGICTVALTAP